MQLSFELRLSKPEALKFILYNCVKNNLTFHVGHSSNGIVLDVKRLFAGARPESRDQIFLTPDFVKTEMAALQLL